MIAAADAWGPFAPDLDPAERIGRLRCLTAITHLSCGPHGAELVAALRAAETDAEGLPAALAALERLAPLDRRRVLASYATLNRPADPRRAPSHRSR